MSDDRTMVISWRAMFTAKCLGGMARECPMSRDPHYELVLVSYVEGLHKHIAKLETQLKALADIPPVNEDR